MNMLKLKIGIFTFLFALFSMTSAMAQQTQIKGKVVGSTDQEPLPDVIVSIENTSFSTKTESSGNFTLEGSNLPLGEQVLTITKEGFGPKRFPIVVNSGETLNLDVLEMDVNISDAERNIAEISLSENELDSERNSASNLSGLLSASKDVFFKAAAYDFGSTFFNPRGLDNENGRVLINGIEMNKMIDGRPEYSDFGGLNDARRNQTFFMGLKANPFQFGGLAGTTNSVMRASQYREGGKISYASSNRSYRGRVMASYNSGLMSNGWAYSVLASRRYGNRGYKEGTSYNANGFFASVEKKISNEHSLNFTAFYAPKRRGKASGITQEVKDLKGIDYNPNWGYQNGNVRNARIDEVKEPVFMLNHYWDITSKTHLNTNVAYLTGQRGNTRIDNGGTRLVQGPDGQNAYIGGARNTSPDYYQKLPSYFLQDDNLTANDYQSAYLAGQDFKNNGQLDWKSLYRANAIATNKGGNSIYAIQEDRQDDDRISANTILNTELTQNIKLNASLRYRHLHSENFANVKDLLGGRGFLDIDFFADEPRINSTVNDLAQSDLNNPNRLVKQGGRYKYNYDINTDFASAFAQTQFSYKKVDFFIGADVSQTTIERDGKFRNGYYPENSFGKSEKLNFTNYGIKGGATYKVTGQHLINLNAGYFTKAPTIRNSFSNARQNNYPVIDLESQKIQSADLSYIFRDPIIKARLTGYYSEIKDATDIGFYFTQGLSGMGQDNDAAFVQEITTGINKRNIGAEFGIEAQVTPTIKLKAAGSYGQSVYTNNPNLYLTSQDFNEGLLHGGQLAYAQSHEGTPVRFGDGKTKLKDYHVSGGPERAFQVGFEYRDPSYWFVGATSNFFSHAYVDVSKIRRTTNFTTAADGLPLGDYNEKRAQQLLKQKQLGDYMLVNMIGGKSWKVNDYYVGVFGVLSNVLDKEFRSGGYESSRKSNFTEYNEDQSNPNGALFGNSYFFGYGTTFYLNFYVRF